MGDHMRAAGDVLQADIIAQPGTAMGSKGCGLVRYATPEQARRAIRELSETTLKGRQIFVREDREEDMSPILTGAPQSAAANALLDGLQHGSVFGSQSGGRGSGKGGCRPVALGCRVFVGNLAYSVTWKDLKDHMRMAGNIIRCDILPQPGTTLNSKGCGIAEYSCAAEARRAIRELHDTDLKGRPI